jgi:hypothetical protein
MSISSLEVIEERIESAKHNSPIAVFKYSRLGVIVYNAVFADTYETQQRIKGKDKTLVGCYNGKNGASSLMVDLGESK